MKLLVVADEESRSLWDFYSPEKLEDVDLIISCGDLNSNYLQFLVTFAHCPLLYVRGNHDSGYALNPPDGCICIEDRIYDYKGLRILGLGGSMRYKPGDNMFTEAQMRRRIRKMRRQIWLHGGFDVLVTHSPAAGYGDMCDLPHQGFACFNDLLNRYKPLYMLHGHVHKTYGRDFVRVREHESGTLIINAYETYEFTIPDELFPDHGKTGAFLYDMSVRLKEKFRRKHVYDDWK